MKRNNKNVDRKMKTDNVETCLNCVFFTNCANIGMIDDCEDSFEVERDEVVVIISLEEYNKLRSRKESTHSQTQMFRIAHPPAHHKTHVMC